MISNDTIIAMATPPGVGALGIIRIAGPRAFELVDRFFIGANLLEAASHTIHFGVIQNQAGEAVDDCLTFLFRGPNSYTGDDVVELSCHGSPYILQTVLEVFLKEGVRLAKPGEFTMRAFLNGKMDLSQAEAVADLIASNTQAAHDLAIRQMRGGVSEEIQNLRQELIDFAALIELELDFSEEDVEFADREKLEALIHKIKSYLHQLLHSFKLGNALKEGVSTVIAGRPNAGKSTLLNALLQEERAIVTDVPGTTRDTIEEILNIEGVPFRLIDTAGVREAQDQVEAIGVERTKASIESSQILLYVFDVTHITPMDVHVDIQSLRKEGQSAIMIANKMDLNPFAHPERYAYEDILLITASAKNKMNMEYIKESLYKLIVDEEIQADDVVVSNVRHVGALQQADQSLDAVLNGLASGVTHDFIAIDIRQALHHLGEITGEIYTDDLLDSIFSRFCIGK